MRAPATEAVSSEEEERGASVTSSGGIMFGDYETVESVGDASIANLLDGVNCTTQTDHMWLLRSRDWPCLYHPQAMIVLRIDLKKVCMVSALKVWNYNVSRDESYKGVRQLRVLVDGLLVSPEEGFLIRKAPGESPFDYG